jgi:hypothetical protein
MSEHTSLEGRVLGNREVSHRAILAARGDLSGACGEAIAKEGGSWGKQRFPHGSEPKASDERGVSA